MNKYQFFNCLSPRFRGVILNILIDTCPYMMTQDEFNDADETLSGGGYV